MNPWSVSLFFSALLCCLIGLPFLGYTRRVHLFNYNLGKAMGMGQEVNPQRTHDRVFWLCFLLLLVGGGLYLIGWWLGGNKGVELGREVGEGDLRTLAILADNTD